MQGNITLFCSFGTLDSITLFGQSLLSDNSSCSGDGENFKYSPRNCYYEKFTDSQQDTLDSLFAKQCAGNTTCNFIFNSTVLPTMNCMITPGTTQSQYIYFLQAACKADEINLLQQNKVYLKKEKVALVVVLLDIAISFILYFGFQHLRAMQLLTNSEINESIVVAQDFGVQIWGLPPHKTVRELKAEMWTWMEAVNQKERHKMVNPGNEVLDENQDTVMNVQFGLTDYGRLKYMLRMADLLK